MGRKSTKQFQLIITGYLYNEAEYPSEVSIITKEQLEELRPLFLAISKNTDNYNWSTQTELDQNEYGGWEGHLYALRKMYPEFNSKRFELLVVNLFPNRGYVDSINRVEINEIKNIETFDF